MSISPSRQSARTLSGGERGQRGSRVMLFVPELFMSFPKIGRYLHRAVARTDGEGRGRHAVTSGHGHAPRRGKEEAM